MLRAIRTNGQTYEDKKVIYDICIHVGRVYEYMHCVELNTLVNDAYVMGDLRSISELNINIVYRDLIRANLSSSVLMGTMGNSF